jgi:integrase/recombinase XerD
MAAIDWVSYPFITMYTTAREWLQIQADLGLARNTVQAYGRGVEEFLRSCHLRSINPHTATKADIAAYVQELLSRPSPRGPKVLNIDSGVGLSNATLQLRLTAVRLYYDYLIEEGVRATNPVGRGRYTPGKGFATKGERGILPRYKKLPWIPNDEQWLDLLQVAKDAPVRTRFMLALAYDAGLRREELCTLLVTDINPGQRLVTIRAEVTKSKNGRTIPYSEPTAALYKLYLNERRLLSRDRGPLFLSNSNRNRAEPISIWTWSKVTHALAMRAGVPEFTSHTLRHLCLTDLARANWDVHEIATFAGHRNIQTTLIYIHLSGRELKAKLQQSMQSIHNWRMHMLKEQFV